MIKRDADCVEQYTPKHYYGGDAPHNDSKWEEKWQKDFAEYTDLGDGYSTNPMGYTIHKDGLLFSLKSRSDYSIRTNADLVWVVEELGRAANGRFAKLKIVEVPDGIEWEIDEYDGVESVHEKHRTWS